MLAKLPTSCGGLPSTHPHSQSHRLMATDDGEGLQPVVLITGCAKGGIGYEYCQAFAGLGCRVVATDIPDQVPG